jgi:aryl-alcohol dehydrogenase-like predicted oxidoreductase
MTYSAVSNDAADVALGAVQFGLDYGVSNPNGRTMPDEVARILQAARGYGIKILDTAAAYGESESVLGQVMGPAAGFEIVTKTPVLGHGADVRLQVRRSFEQSLERLRQDKVYGLLAHNCDDLLGDDGDIFYDALRELRDEGVVSKIGASVYEPDQVRNILERFQIDIIQLPLSIFDQRMHGSGMIDRLASAGVEIHVRSCFLQGVLLMRQADLPDHLRPLEERLVVFRQTMAECGLSPLAGALAFVRHCDGVDAVVVGVCSEVQLDEIAVAAQANFPSGLAVDMLAVDDPALIDPRNWSQC